MKKIEPDHLMAALAEALETMAFVAVDPAFDLAACVDLMQVSLGFTGVVSGQLTLCAPALLGTVIAANLSAATADLVSAEHALDALRELANVTAGLLLRQVCAPEEMPQLAIPTVSSTPAVIGAEPCCLASLTADGYPVTISLRTRA